MRVRSTVVALLGVVLALAPAGPASAYHSDRQRELQRLITTKRSQIAELSSQEQDILDRINASAARQARLEDEIAAIEGRLARARENLHVIEVRLDSVSAELRAKNAELEQTLADLDEQTTILNTRIAEIYISAPSAFAQAFQAAEDFDDLVSANDYVNSVVASDQRLVEQIETTRATIEDQRVEIEARKASLEADRKTAEATAAEIAGIRNERASVRAKVAREVSYQRYLLGEIRARKSQYQRMLDSYVRESNDIALFLRGAQAGQTVIQGRGGWLKWPVSGRISSGYGWRTHPIYGYRSFHTGIDIAAPSGTTVRSARRGVVLDTGYRGAYGLVVIIDHGNAVATMYAHLSRVYVRPGEHVGTLESIAAVGSTGWSTGPHLHFEVRVNGEHQNPMRWL